MEGSICDIGSSERYFSKSKTLSESHGWKLLKPANNVFLFDFQTQFLETGHYAFWRQL